MKKLLTSLSLACALAVTATSQSTNVQTDAEGIVTIAARGADVRPLLHDLFTQSKKNYVLEPGVRYVLYLSLAGVDFEEALQIVCMQAELQYEVQNGIFYISKLGATKRKEEAKPAIEARIGTLPSEVLLKKVTTRLRKADLTVVLSALGKQTGVRIELDKDAPRYKLDAFLVGTSLKHALDTITKATGLEYKLTDSMSILVKEPDPNKVVVVKSGG